jgi:hypothetical protein
MLKKTMIAAAIAGAAMLAIAGSANAANGKGLTTSAPSTHMTSEAAPKTFKIAGKRRLRHGRRFHRWNDRHYRPDGCHWLRRKARWTGKRYWWKRYSACRHHYYY